MVILISGATHTGKTKLAQRFLEKYNIPYLSIDHLKMGLIRSGYTSLTVKDDEELTLYLWPIVREMAKTAIENGQNLIIEGCYIPFDWQKDIDKQYLLSIKYICLAMTDLYIESHFDDIIKHSSDIEKRLDDSYCSIELLKKLNRFYIENCKKHNHPLTLINDDYAKPIDSLLHNHQYF